MKVGPDRLVYTKYMKLLPVLSAFTLAACQSTQQQPPPPKSCPFKADNTKPEILQVENPLYRESLEEFVSEVPPDQVKAQSQDFNRGFVAGVRDAHTLFRNAVHVSTNSICILLVEEQCPMCPVPQHLEDSPEEEGAQEAKVRPTVANPEAFDAGYDAVVLNRGAFFDLRKLPVKVRAETVLKCQVTLRYLAGKGHLLPTGTCNTLANLAHDEIWEIIQEAAPCSKKSCTIP